MNRRKRSVFYKVLLINTAVSFVLICIYMFNYLFFDYKSKQENSNYSDKILNSMTQNFESEMIRLSTLTELCTIDRSFILTASNRLPLEDFYTYSQESSEKLKMLQFSLPYADNDFIYMRSGKIFIFPGFTVSKGQIDLLNSKGITANNPGFPADLSNIDFDNLKPGFYPINENYSLYAANILDCGLLVIKLDTAKFCNLNQINSVLPDYYVAVLDDHNRVFSISSQAAIGLLNNIDIQNINTKTAVIEGIKYSVMQKITSNGFRFVLIGKTTALQNIQQQNVYVGIVISISIFAVCLILILVNAALYNPLRRIVKKYGSNGPNRNEIDFISGKVLQLLNENSLMQEQIKLQRLSQADIELNFAINSKGGMSQQLADQLKNQYGRYIIIAIALQGQNGDGEENILAADDYLFDVSQCKVVAIDQFMHAYLIPVAHETGDVVTKIEGYFKSIGQNLLAYIGISDESDDFSNINKVYMQAYERMSSNRIPENTQYAICTKDSKASQHGTAGISLEMQNTIAKYVFGGSSKDIEGLLNYLFFSFNPMTLKSAVTVYSQLSSLLLILLANTNANSNDLNILKKIPAYNPIYMYHSILEDYIKLNSHQSQEHSALKYGIIDYLQKHLNEPLSLDSISTAFGITSVYLSAWFKKNTGVNLSIYLSNIRMEEAKKIMSENKHIKISDLSQRVGIPSVSAFIRQFKNYTGTTPDQYRQRDGG